MAKVKEPTKFNVNNPTLTQNYTDRRSAIESKISSINDFKSYETFIKELRELSKDIHANQKDLAQLGKTAKELFTTRLTDKWTKWLNENSSASEKTKQRIRELIAELKQMGTTDIQANEIVSELNKIATKTHEAGEIGKSFYDQLQSRMRSLAVYLSSFVGFQDFLNMFRQGIDIVHQLDDSYTKMRKVSNESAGSLKAYQFETFDIADDIGSTAKNIQDSTANWMRLGESMSEAAKSAKADNVLLNISEFDNIADATESMISVSSAYKDLEKMDINDVLNNLGNNYSISTDGLATALKDSASALSTAHNDFYEAASLATAANTIVQDPSKVGAGLRTIALRLTGTEYAKQQLQEMGEDVDDFVVTTSSEMNEAIMDLTSVNGEDGVSILDMNGNYRSTYEILQDIADVWEQIAKEDVGTGQNRQNALLEMIAGKNRSNILSSILQSPEVLRSAYEDALNSEGSALKENEAYLDSLSGKIQLCTNQLQKFAVTTIDSNFLKGAVDAGTSLLKVVTGIIDEVGILAPLLSGLFTGISMKNGGGFVINKQFLLS